MQLPVGYAIKVVPSARRGSGDFTVVLSFNGEVIGNVRVYETTIYCAGRSTKVCETHSCLDEKHRNKGLGLAMYSEAIAHGIKNGHTVVSSCGPSLLAKRVWCSKRLASAYVVSKLARRWWISRERSEGEQS